MDIDEDASFREKLSKEVSEWQQEGLVRPDQAQMILARYGLVPGETQRSLRQSRLVLILGVLGVILVGVGVILLVGANWDAIARPWRLAILVAATAGVYHFGYVMAYRSRKYPKIGMALLLLGSLLWGASIFLVGQMYNLGGGGGDGGEIAALFYWFIGVLPLAYILISPLHLTLSLVIGTIWLMLALNRTYFSFGVTTSFLLALGTALYCAGRLHSKWRLESSLQAPYRWIGIILTFAALYAAGFRYSWVGYSDVSTYGVMWLYVPMFVLAATALAAMTIMTRSDRSGIYEAAGFAVIALTSVAILPVQSSHMTHSLTLLMMIMFNLILLVWEIGLVMLGWQRSDPGLANAGILAFALQVFTRYFDLFGTMLQSGFLFIGAGLLLVVGGFLLERYRRRLLSDMAQRRST